jgi:hypothetical protein
MMQNERANNHQETGTEKEFKRFENLMDVYQNFSNYLNPDFVLEQQKLGNTIPWDVRYDEDSRRMEVRYSDEFAKKYMLNTSKSDPPIFLFQLDSQFRTSYDQLKSPISRVEINIVSDSAFDDQTEKGRKKSSIYDHWEFNVQNESAKLVKKPNKYFINEVDFDSSLSKLTHFSFQEFDNTLDKILANEKLSPFAQNLVEIGKSLVRSSNIEGIKDYSETLSFSIPNLNSREIKALKTVYRIVEQSTRKEETMAYSFLFDSDNAQKRKKITNIGIAAVAGISLIGASPWLYILALENEKESQNEKKSRKYSQSNDVYINELENKELSKSADLLKTLDTIGEKWSVEPDVLGDRFFFHLDNLVSMIKLVATGKLQAELLNEKFEFTPNIEEAINHPKYNISLDERIPGDKIMFKEFFRNVLKEFPFFTSVLSSIDNVDGDSGRSRYFYYNNGDPNSDTILSIPTPFGEDWYFDNYEMLILTLHEMTHGFRSLSLNEIKKYISIEDYCEILSYQLTLSDEVIDTWINERGTGNFIQDQYLFSDWLFNYDGTDNDDFVSMVRDFKYENIKYFDTDGDYEVNAFMYWAIKRYKDIKAKQEDNVTLEELDFLEKYSQYQIGNKAISHVCHHLESFLPFDPKYSQTSNLEEQRNKLFSLICKKLLNKSDKDVIDEIEKKILGNRIDTSLPNGVNNFNILSIFNVNNAKGIYNSNGELEHLIEDRNLPFNLYITNEPLSGKTFMYLPFNQDDDSSAIPLNEFENMRLVIKDRASIIAVGKTKSGVITSNTRWTGFEVKEMLKPNEFQLEIKQIKVNNQNPKESSVLVAKIEDKEYHFTNCYGDFKNSKILVMTDGTVFIKYPDGTYEFDLQSRAKYGEITGNFNSQNNVFFDTDENRFLVDISGTTFFVESNVQEDLKLIYQNYPGTKIRYRLIKDPNSENFKYEIFILDRGIENTFKVLEKVNSKG